MAALGFVCVPPEPRSFPGVGSPSLPPLPPPQGRSRWLGAIGNKTRMTAVDVCKL